MNNYASEILSGERFEFGSNWRNFLSLLNEDRIEEAKISLKKMLEVQNLSHQKFIDIGSGSGLFSLAAKMLGAEVLSFDYDPNSVNCTKELKNRFFPSDADWQVQSGSVLDTNFLQGLGTYDVVYSWGVLHHTGEMWSAIQNIIPLVKPEGKVFIAIYNDQGYPTARWKQLKKMYNKFNFLRIPLLVYGLLRNWTMTFLRDSLKGNPFKTWNSYKKERGMSPWYDVVDWIGGYPFEVAKPEEIFDFFHKRNFELIKIKTCAGGHGCNEYVFQNKISKS